MIYGNILLEHEKITTAQYKFKINLQKSRRTPYFSVPHNWHGLDPGGPIRVLFLAGTPQLGVRIFTNTRYCVWSTVECLYLPSNVLNGNPAILFPHHFFSFSSQ